MSLIGIMRHVAQADGGFAVKGDRLAAGYLTMMTGVGLVIPRVGTTK